MQQKSLFILFFVFLSFSFLQAETTLNDSIMLDELVVTGSKFETSRKLVPLSVSQISTKDIEQSGQYNVLSTISSYVPGVFITERNILGFGVSAGGSGVINMRGVGSSPNTQVLVLIDGHPQYQGIFAHPLPDAYVASDVRKVEVIRGPGSVLYGSNAMVGVINIITKKQEEEGFSTSVNATYGSYNTQKYAATLGFKKNKFSAFVSGNYDKTDGIRANTDFNIKNGFAKVGYDFNSHWKLTGDVSLAQFNANDAGPVHAPSPFNIDIFRGKAAVSLENNYSKIDGALKLYHNFGNHNLSDGFISSDRNSGLMLYQNYKMHENTYITLGFDAKQFGGRANSGVNANIDIFMQEIAAYALVRQKLFEVIDFNAGLRYEHHSVFGSEWVPMAGASVEVSETSTFKTSVSKGYRSPSMMELYLYAPNDALQPERMLNVEASWLKSWLDRKLHTELTVFLVDGNNMIEVVPGVPAKRYNVGSFANKGIEFSARYAILRDLNVQANYTFLDMRKRLIAAPKHQTNINLNYQLKKFNFNVSAQYINGLYTSITPEITQNYALLNARVSYKVLKQLELFASGHNLLNQQYEVNYGYPMPGINFHGGFNFIL